LQAEIFNMFNRRIIRIKVLQTLFAYYSESFASFAEAEKDLKYSFDRVYDLYFFIIQLIIEIRHYAFIRIEKAKNKFLPEEKDLKPNTKFIENVLIAQLKDNELIQKYLTDRKFTWNKEPEVLRVIYDNFIQTDEYQAYMSENNRSYDSDKKILVFFVSQFLYNSEFFYSTLEEESIYWVDAVDFILKKITKTIDKFKQNKDNNELILNKFKNKDDSDFALKLLHKSILNKKIYDEIIQENIVHWDIERISNIDRLILMLAVSEFLDFNEIPVKVTLNEYIELAKIYGTPQRSANFTNGVLDKIVKHLKEQNKIKKVGRGLKD